MLRGPATIHLSPRLNFITGRNGTGKSRIVVALQLALGAKSSDTGRGKNLNNFICNDSSVTEATIEVIMYNGGENAFRPQLYGEYFVLSRKLKRNSDPKKPASSPFSIWFTHPETGALQSAGSSVQARKELRELFLDHVRIKPRNPMVILTQDESKRLLDSTKPESLYQVFLQATDLDKVGQDFIKMEKSLDDEEKIAERLEKEIEVHLCTQKDLEARLETSKQFATLHEQIQRLQDQRAVRRVQDLQQQSSALNSDMGDKQEQLKQLEQEQRAIITQLDSIDDELEKKRLQLAEKKGEREIIFLEHDNAKEKLRQEIGHILNEKKDELKLLKFKIDNVEARVRKDKKELASEQRKSKQTRHHRDPNEIEERLREVEADLESLTQELHDLRKSEGDLDRREDEQKKSLDVDERLLDHKKKQHYRWTQELKQSRGSNDPFFTVKAAINECVVAIMCPYCFDQC